MDQVECEYQRRILMADTDEAYELSIRLSQYQQLYKDILPEEVDDDEYADLRRSRH